MKISVLAAIGGLMIALLLSVAPAAARDSDLAFEAGKSYAVASYSVIRGERDTYYFDARPGQLISIAITSLEDNAVFELDSRQGGDWYPAGGPSEPRTWYGPLPPSDGGAYRITVGGTRGNATYDLFVGISAVTQP